MPERAQVTSVEAIESFRAKLIVYMSKARAALDEASDEVRHTRTWLDFDQRGHWEKEWRRRNRELEEAQQVLFSAKMSRLQTQTAVQALAVERARQAMRQADEKRDCVRRWARDFDNRADPMVKQADQLLTFVTTDLVKAVAHLAAVIKALEAYTASSHNAPVEATALPPSSEAAENAHVTSQSETHRLTRPAPAEDTPP